jgi:TRAP-type mannitol/chloroaromatic compound transport system substrate-binding protein
MSTTPFNRRVWENFDNSDRQLIEMAAAAEYAVSLAEFNTNNAKSLGKLRAEGTVNIRKFDDEVLKTPAEISKDVVAEVGSGDELSRKIYRSYSDFGSLIRDWRDIAEGGYLGIPPVT